MLIQARASARVNQRDTQRQKVYRSDPALKPWAEPLPTVKDVERFCRKVWASKRMRKAFPRAVAHWKAPRVKDGRGTRIARGGMGPINIPLWARSTDVVLHELAHTVTMRVYDDRVPAHGWQYCEVYLRIVLYAMGREAHDALKAAFKKNGVRFRKPRQGKPLSPERRAQLVATLAQARAKRAPKAAPGAFPDLILD